MKNRLLIIVPLHKDQSEPAKRFLMDASGRCSCGRAMTSTSSKFLLCNMISSYAPDPKARDTLIIGAYCYSCAGEINDTLKRIRLRGEQTMKFINPEK